MATGRARWLRPLAGLAVGLPVAFAAATATADVGDRPHDLASARRAFRQAVAAQDAGRYMQALDLYLAAGQVAVSSALLFNMASCHEKLGHLVLAVEGYSAAARIPGDAEITREARSKVATISAILPHLVVRAQLPADVDDVVVLIDGRPTPGEGLGWIAADPGEHRLAITSGRTHRSFETTVQLLPGQNRVVDVNFVPPERGPPSGAGALRPSPTGRARASLAPAILSCGAALALVEALVTGLAGNRARADYVALNGLDTETPGNRAERADLRDRSQALYAANAALAGSAVILAALAVYFALHKAGPPAQSGSNLWTLRFAF